MNVKSLRSILAAPALIVLLALAGFAAPGDAPAENPNEIAVHGCRISVVGHRLVNSIEDGEKRWFMDPGLRILILKLQIDKPVGPMLFHNSDFVLQYRHADGREDRSKCTAIRTLGARPDNEGGLWGLPSDLGGYIAAYDHGIDEATRGYIEIGCPLEDDVNDVQLAIAAPTASVTVNRDHSAEQSRPSSHDERSRAQPAADAA